MKSKHERQRSLWMAVTAVLGSLTLLVLIAGCSPGAQELPPDEELAATVSPSPTPSTPPGEGTMTVFPTSVLAGSYETLTFQFTVGPSGMEIGGGLKIQLPVRQNDTPPVQWAKCQTESPNQPGYVQASVIGASGVRVNLRCTDAGYLYLTLRRRALAPGGQIGFTYSGNVQALARTLALRVGSRRTEQDSWTQIASLPEIQILPAEAALLHVVAPADVVGDSGFELAIVALDRLGNRATGYRGTVSFASSDADARLPPPYAFTAEDRGLHLFSGLRYTVSGFQRTTVTDGTLAGQSNPSYVTLGPSPSYRRYFGDTHFHTGTGAGNLPRPKESEGMAGDHQGDYTTEEEAYAYARDVMRLDFASASEHDGEAFTDALWIKSQDISESFYQPGVFTTFFAYEWTPIKDKGHRVVVYKDYGNQIYRSVDHEYDTIIELWAALEAQGVPSMTIPHVMWKTTENFEVHPLWADINNEFQPIGEIYSARNPSAKGGPVSDDPQGFELGIDDPWSYQYAWHRGHKIGVIGSTDNHLGKPGENDLTPFAGAPGGLAVVLAERNDRDAIWEAFESRRTYATTGTRIYLDLGIDGHLMGEEFTSRADPAISVSVAGTNSLEMVELIKHESSGYMTIYVDEPSGEISSFDFVDAGFREDSFYYVRVTQVDGEMAWSSPIWISWEAE